MSSIDDIREIKDFKQISFSGFKKQDVVKELNYAFDNCLIESAIYWCGELVCSGNFKFLWENIISYMSVSINILNPKLPIFMQNRFNVFKTIINSGYLDRELHLRNHNTIRQLFSEICLVLCCSKKKQINYSIKLNKEIAYDLIKNSNKLNAPNIEYIKPYFEVDDSKDLFVACNEFAYNLSKDSNNVSEAIYWIEWILNYCAIKKKIICNYRGFPSVLDKYKKNFIWIIWEIILDHSTCDQLTSKIIHSLLDIFCIHYSEGTNRKRKKLIYFAISIIIDKYNSQTPLIDKKKEKEQLNISKYNNKVYSQIKKMEHSSKTGYLFNNANTANNFEKSISKLNAIKKIPDIFRTGD